MSIKKFMPIKKIQDWENYMFIFEGKKYELLISKKEWGKIMKKITKKTYWTHYFYWHKIINSKQGVLYENDGIIEFLPFWFLLK